MSRLGASFPGQPQPSCQSWSTSDSLQETEILTHRKFSNILSVSSWCHRKWLVTCRSDRKLYPESPVHVSRVRHRATKQEEEASGGHWSWNTEKDSSSGVGEEAWVRSSTLLKSIFYIFFFTVVTGAPSVRRGSQARPSWLIIWATAWNTTTKRSTRRERQGRVEMLVINCE